MTSNIKLTTEEFIERAIKVHGDKYDYLPTQYQGRRKEITINCKEHGIFSQMAFYHLRGQEGCRKCFLAKKTKSTQQFIEDSIGIHGNKYGYRLADYKGNNTRVIIICCDHGQFTQTPASHLMGRGCPKCGVKSSIVAKKKTGLQFIEQAIIIHGHQYNYLIDMENYNHSKKIAIECKRCGNRFNQDPRNHLQGNGCPKCSIIISHQETKWLDTLAIPDDNEHRQVNLKINGKKYSIDGFDPITNTVYEFYGDFWHGNPNIYKSEDENSMNYKTFGELYQKTIDREVLLKKAGYNLVIIWEQDWKRLKKEAKNG